MSDRLTLHPFVRFLLHVLPVVPVLACGVVRAENVPLEKLQWISEEYAPYNFSENGEPKGIAVDVLRQMWQALGIPNRVTSIHMLPWARAYRMAQEQPGTCLFSMIATPERRQMFAFIGPLAEINVSAIVPADRNLRITSVRQLDALSVGVVRDDIGEQVLQRAGAHSQLVRTDSARSLVRMLQAKRFDAAVYSFDTFLWTLKRDGGDAAAFKSAFKLYDSVLGYACHKDTDPAVLKRLQRALDRLVADGTVERIRKQYLSR